MYHLLQNLKAPLIWKKDVHSDRAHKWNLNRNSYSAFIMWILSIRSMILQNNDVYWLWRESFLISPFIWTYLVIGSIFINDFNYVYSVQVIISLCFNTHICICERILCAFKEERNPFIILLYIQCKLYRTKYINYITHSHSYIQVFLTSIFED